MSKSVLISNANPNSLSPVDNDEFLPRETALSVGVSSNAKAEIEAQLMMADARPRNEARSISRIMNSCARPRLAEDAAYSYSRGGTEISGPSIRLLEVIAQKWGNIKWGFHELSRVNGESVCMCYAIDLESNARVERMIVVKHEIGLKGGGRKYLADDRDIYEKIANHAQRRVRTCLENIIPRDVIEDALEQCETVLRSKVEINKDVITKILAMFDEYDVTREMLEAFIQRDFTVDAVKPGHVLRLRKIYNALKDGAAQPEDFFKMPEAPKVADSSKFDEPEPEAAKPKKATASKKGTSKKVESEKKVEKTEKNTDPEKDEPLPAKSEYTNEPKKRPWNSMEFTVELDKCTTEKEVNAVIRSFDMSDLSEDDANWAFDAADNRKIDLAE